MSKKLNKLNYVDQAEDVVKHLSANKNGKILITTSKIRNILSLINELYAMVNKADKKLDADIQSRVQYTRMKIVYEAGRDNYVKEFCDKSDILEYLKGVGDSTDDLLLVCHYMESLVAFHKFYTTEK